MGNMLLRVANAVREAKDMTDSFFFDVLLEGKHLGGEARITPRNHDRGNA